MSTPAIRAAHPRRMLIAILGSLLTVSVAGVSAHVVRGSLNPTLATALVSSPTGAPADAPVRVAWGDRDTGLRVVCFNVANTSPARPDDGEWPRVTAVGFELPGSLSGFSLVEPLGTEWQLAEGAVAAIPGKGTVELDFVLVAGVNPAGWAEGGPTAPSGLAPGQPSVPGTGRRFCVSGPFPDTLPNPANPASPLATTVERLISGVVVRFHRVLPAGPSQDVGIWDNAQRTIPQYPE